MATSSSRDRRTEITRIRSLRWVITADQCLPTMVPITTNRGLSSVWAVRSRSSLRTGGRGSRRRHGACEHSRGFGHSTDQPHEPVGGRALKHGALFPTHDGLRADPDQLLERGLRKIERVPQCPDLVRSQQSPRSLHELDRFLLSFSIASTLKKVSPQSVHTACSIPLTAMVSPRISTGNGSQEIDTVPPHAPHVLGKTFTSASAVTINGLFLPTSSTTRFTAACSSST